MDARERFITALAERVSDVLYREGIVWLDVQEIGEIADQAGAESHDARAALRMMDDNGLLLMQEGGHSYSDGVGLVLRYEEGDRRLFWERNKLRREILKLAARGYEEGNERLTFKEGAETFIDVPWSEAYGACQILEHMGLLEVRAAMGHNFWTWTTSEGYELQRDERQLARELPTSAAEDELAGQDVVADALRDLITSVEDLLDKRGWEGAVRELRRGDDQYRDGHWTDAVREYYAALESGLKHRLDEAGVSYSEGAALKDLAKQAAGENLLPINYQALYGFVDTIRSPRSHGAGGKPEEVEVGRAEALLMGNHVRALLLYLGQQA